MPSRPTALCLSVLLSLTLGACGGSNDDKKDCGSAGNTRNVHCAP